MKNESIQAIKAQLATIATANDPRITQWQTDERKGVQAALLQWQKRLAKLADQQKQFDAMCQFEDQARQTGYELIAGIDEVGRGPLAGPVVAAAVILPEKVELIGINDSKQLSLQKREAYFTKIQEVALAIGIGIADEKVIDEINIYEATKQAMQAAIAQLTPQPDYLLIDAMKLPVALPQESLIKGDARSISIAAASIIAKVTRDRMMEAYDEQYPGYGFAKNAGYGTKEHLAGLDTFGICPIHRRTFAPIKNML